MLRVVELTDFSEFNDLKDSWNRNLQKSKDNDVFSTWEWLWCWWKHFGNGRQLRILLAQEKDKILSIAPLMLSKYKFLRFGKLQKVEFIGAPNSDYNNFILLKRPKECLKLFLTRLMQLADWDLLELRDISEERVSADVLRMMCQSQTSKLVLKLDTLCPYIKLPDSFEVFASRLSPNMRRNLRKRLRRLREKYKVAVKTQRDFDSVKEAMETLFRLNLKRWRSEGKPGSFALTAFRNFHLDLAEIFNKKGWLSMHFLTVNDEPVAAVYSFDYNRKKYGYLTGFDPEFGCYSVGNLLKMHIVEYCIEKGFREYDLTRGFEPYKADWATGVRRNFVARMTYRGWFAKMYIWSTQNNFCNLAINKLGAHFTVERC